ncbi:MAG: hypothetical protein AB7L90_01360 [Hyphomicrobiaceae bacterium]
MSEFPTVGESRSWDDVQAELEAADLGDGLPLVPPTEVRLAAMLTGIADPEQSLGFMPPLFGDVTPRAVAYNAVLAGCRPAELRVVIAAVTACLEPELNLLGLMTTTGSAAVATCVHGPIVSALDLNPGINCLGPGNRANAAIGRAVSLCLRNIGGARAGSGDMATCGQPGKYTFCFAEPEDGPYPPLHVRRGMPAGSSAVTVMGVSGTAEVLPLRDGEGGDAGADAILDALTIIMRASAETTGASRQPEPPEQVFILPLELSERLLGAGIGLSDVQKYLFEAGGSDAFRMAPGPEHIFPIVTGGAGVKMAYLPLWGGGSRMVTRAI